MFQNLSTKKIVALVVFILISIGFAIAIYYLFFKSFIPEKKTPPPTEISQLPTVQEGTPTITQPETTPTDLPAELPTKSVTKIVVPSPEITPDTIARGGITESKVLNFEKTDKLTLDRSGKRPLVYNAESGLFYSIDDSGARIILNDQIYKSAETVIFSPQKDQAILEFPDGSNILFDFDKKKQISLPKQWTDFSFNSGGNKIAFKDMSEDPNQRFIGIANSDGSQLSYIEQIGPEPYKFIIDWSPNEQIIGQFRTGDTSSTSKIYFFGKNDENFKAITALGLGVQTQWTPDGSKILYSAYNEFSDFQPSLYLVDASGNNIGANNNSLRLNTWANKCSFANNNTVYCAVPKELPMGAGMVPRLADSVPDYIYKVDLKTGSRSFIAEPVEDITIDQIVVTQDESALYFTDKETGNTHEIKLR